MGDLLTFAPRPKPAAPPAVEALSEAEIRVRIEAIAEAAVDTAERMIALLDRMDGCPDDEDGGDAEPSLAAPEGHDSQIGWCRGGDEDREAEAPERALPEVAIDIMPPSVIDEATTPEPVPEIPTASPVAVVIPRPPLRWGGSGNVVAAAGVALFDLLERA